MSGSKATKGPWACRPSAHRGYVVRARGCLVADVIPQGSAEANARLIAAAPELLEALEKLVAADNCNYERDTMRSEGYFDAARAAIGKAVGS